MMKNLIDGFIWRIFRNKYLNKTVKKVEDFAQNPSKKDDFALYIAEILNKSMTEKDYVRYFRLWEEHGFHITPNHFYQPVPDTRTLKDNLWGQESSLPGVDMNLDIQLEFLRNIFPKYESEYNKFPDKPSASQADFYLTNGGFDGFDALVLYCMLRHFKPNKMIECGCGNSTLLTAKTALMNGNMELICIEPFPNDILKKSVPGLSKLYPQKIEDTDFNMFKTLNEGDILFIDTSHVVKCGSDVNLFYLEIIPRLNKGVIVHIHDIFFPFEYPKEWVLKMYRFWTEQYLLQAFLAFNSDFEVLFSNSYMGHKYYSEMISVFPNSPGGGSSFWMCRKK